MSPEVYLGYIIYGIDYDNILLRICSQERRSRGVTNAQQFFTLVKQLKQEKLNAS